MKVVEGNLLFRSTNPEDALLMQTISFALNNWFGSDVSDLKEIISDVSMAPADTFIITYEEFSSDHLTLSVDVSDDEFILIFHRGDMVNPFPRLEVKRGETVLYYALTRTIKVEQITLPNVEEYTEEQKAHASMLLHELLEDD